MSTSPILAARGLTKRFGEVAALRDVTFDLRAGEIHALCGENGAGKSTLIKTLAGVHPHGSYAGEVEVGGRPARFRGVADAGRAGLAVIFQELALVEEMTVAENIFLGSEPRHGWWIDHDRMRRGATALLERFRITLDPDAPVRTLGIGQKQLVEIVKALRRDSRILILDEPTAALSGSEVDVLLRILAELRARGVGLIYISHKLDEVKRVADRITVLRDGATITTLAAARADVTEIIRAMVGREIQDLFPRDRSRVPGETLLEVKGLSVRPPAGQTTRLRDISFTVRAGEVVGLGGLMGAGRSETLMHLVGAFGTRTAGTVTLAGAPLPPAPTPRAALDRGLVLVTEDRKRYGLVLGQDIGFNLSLSSLRRFTRGLLLDDAAERAENARHFTRLHVRAPGLDAVVGGLSGGNQQKVVLGKALMLAPKVMLLDEPTRGIDVGAKLEVYQLINRLTAEGLGVVLVSSELPELMGMSDRIVMLHEGRVGGEFRHDEATQEKLLAAAMGREG